MNKKELLRRAAADALIPIRPGKVKGQPFWNEFATHFICAPSFEFKKVSGAKAYKFTACDRLSVKHTFTADSPYASLAPVWAKLAIGPVTITVTALDENGKKIGDAGSRLLYRKPYFTNSYPPKPYSYDDAAKKAFEYLFKLGVIQYLKKGEPDPDYWLNCYPSKMLAAVITGMANYSEMAPEHKDEALDIAVKAADYVIATAIPAGDKLEYLPRTYAGNNLPKTYQGEQAGPSLDMIMMIYPSAVGSAMLKLAQVVPNGKKYLDYARKIGDQYLRLQQPNGSWYLVLLNSTGANMKPNYCGPAGIFSFLDSLSQASGCPEYHKAAEAGVNYFSGLIGSFNWEGQFEDVEAQPKPYMNLSKHIATDVMMYLCRHEPENKKFLSYAREVARFSEDQFIVWEQPGWIHTSNQYDRIGKTDDAWGWYTWHTPAVLEQYRCYTPVDASFAKMIRYFLMMYDLEKDPMDLAKARALGDSMIRFQHEDGRIPTWCRADDPKNDWINCMFSSANALKLLASYDNVKL